MDMISIRRKLMATQNQPAPTGYVTDGLVLWLDGINKGNTTNVWTDLVAGHLFEIRGDVTFGQDYVELSDSTQYLRNDTFTSDPTVGQGTIECVFEYAGGAKSGIMFYPMAITGIMAGIYYNNGIYFLSSRDSSVSRNPFSIGISGSASWSDANKMWNGESKSDALTPNQFDSGLNSLNTIGRRNSNQTSYYTPFAGKIYCIRIYNRQLTRAEVLANYAVDRSRFSLFN